MATLACSKKAVVCVCGSKFVVFSTCNAEKTLEHQREKPTASTGSDDTKGQGSTEVQTTTGDGDPHHSYGQILACNFSASGDFFAVCDDYKQLTVWSAKAEWESISTRSIPRRCVAVAFNHKEDTIYVADKSGDVYSFSLTKSAEEGIVLLGHVSMLLDVAISPDDRFILTADRDEKIRVSCLPNSYHIHTFCLGHTQFVSRLAMLPGLPNTLVSGSGDGTIRLWDYTEGRQLHCVSLNSFQETVSSNSTVGADEGENGDSVSSSSVQGQKEKLATVTCITCSRSHKLIAVSLLNNPTVVIHQIHPTDSGLECRQLCILDCQVSPWSLCFDDDGLLWILRPKESEPLMVYTVCGENETLQLEKLSPTTCNSNTSKIMTKINQDKDFFQGAYKQESFYNSLHKKQMDNVANYRERKQQRMQHQKQKRETQVKGQGSPKTDSPVAKKHKAK